MHQIPTYYRTDISSSSSHNHPPRVSSSSTVDNQPRVEITAKLLSGTVEEQIQRDQEPFQIPHRTLRFTARLLISREAVRFHQWLKNIGEENAKLVRHISFIVETSRFWNHNLELSTSGTRIHINFFFDQVDIKYDVEPDPRIYSILAPHAVQELLTFSHNRCKMTIEPMQATFRNRGNRICSYDLSAIVKGLVPYLAGLDKWPLSSGYFQPRDPSGRGFALFRPTGT